MLNEMLKLFCRCFSRMLSLLIKEISVSLLFSETRGSKIVIFPIVALGDCRFSKMLLGVK